MRPTSGSLIAGIVGYHHASECGARLLREGHVRLKKCPRPSQTPGRATLAAVVNRPTRGFAPISRGSPPASRRIRQR